MSGLVVGILVDTALKQQYLGEMVMQAGHKVGFNQILDRSFRLSDLTQAVDAWVIDLIEPHDQHAEVRQLESLVALDELLGQPHIPVILNDGGDYGHGSDEYHDWVRRMLQRLERLSGDISLQTTSPAKDVWVLGASTGGPAAVQEFIRHLPAGLGIAFIYVQHIDPEQTEQLVKMMARVGHYAPRIARNGLVLDKNTLTVVAADYSVQLHDNGTLAVSKSPWNGCYAPSIDQMGANVARICRQDSGIIIFSGMGDDGAASCRLIRQQGGQVWAQTPASCTITAMPDSAIATGSVSVIGTPVELARALIRHKTHLSAKVRP